MGGGAGRNGGIGSRTGLTTGTKMVGTPGRDGLSATGRPGGMAQNPGAWGMRPQSSIARGTLGAPAVPGLLAEPVPAAVTEEIPAYTPNIFNQDYLNSIVDFRKAMSNRYGWGAAMPGPGPVAAPSISGRWPGQANMPQGPDALANDLSTLMDRRNTTPRRLGGMGGGLGSPGYVTDRAPGYGGRLSNDGRGWGGWNSLGFN